MQQRYSGLSPVPSVHGSGPRHVLSLVPAIEMYDVSKDFQGYRAIDALTLSVEQGQIFGLLGPNGAGKTTTINLISGLSKPTSGTVRVLGYDVRRDTRKVRQLLGVVPQETSLYEELTAWQNLLFHLNLFLPGLSKQTKQAKIEEMLHLVQLFDRKDSHVGTFSGGMKRRLAVARALLHDPALLYLDEPTLGVDVQSRNAIWDRIREIAKRGKTVLLTTNYLEEAQALCHHLAIIDHGTLIASDTPENLVRSYAPSQLILRLRPTSMQPVNLTGIQHLDGVRNVRVSWETPAQDIAKVTITVVGTANLLLPILHLLEEQPCEVVDASQQQPTLDQVFLHLTGTALRDQPTSALVSALR